MSVPHLRSNQIEEEKNRNISLINLRRHHPKSKSFLKCSRFDAVGTWFQDRRWRRKLEDQKENHTWVVQFDSIKFCIADNGHSVSVPVDATTRMSRSWSGENRTKRPSQHIISCATRIQTLHPHSQFNIIKMLLLLPSCCTLKDCPSVSATSSAQRNFWPLCSCYCSRGGKSFSELLLQKEGLYLQPETELQPKRWLEVIM